MSRNIYDLHLRCRVMFRRIHPNFIYPFLHATRHDDTIFPRAVRGSVTILISERAIAWERTVVPAHCSLQLSSFVSISPFRPWRGIGNEGRLHGTAARVLADRDQQFGSFLLSCLCSPSRTAVMDFVVDADTGSLPRIGAGRGTGSLWQSGTATICCLYEGLW